MYFIFFWPLDEVKVVDLQVILRRCDLVDVT